MSDANRETETTLFEFHKMILQKSRNISVAKLNEIANGLLLEPLKWQKLKIS
jgi:hypothetical protein